MRGSVREKGEKRERPQARRARSYSYRQDAGSAFWKYAL
jgi:hypothetical protein